MGRQKANAAARKSGALVVGVLFHVEVALQTPGKNKPGGGGCASLEPATSPPT